MTKATAKPKAVTLATLKDTFSGTFSSGFRKGSDTKYSAVMFNLIQLLPHEVWDAWAEGIKARLTHKNQLTTGEVISRLCEFDTIAPDWWGQQFDEPIRLIGHREQNKLALWARLYQYALDAMPDEDWDAMANWFKYCIDVWEGHRD